MVADGDALAQLPEGGIVEAIAQLGLSHQDNLQQFPVVCLKVGQQPHLFEQLVGQVLGLVDNQDTLPAHVDLLQQEQVDRLQRFQAVESPGVESKLDGNRSHQLVGIQHRVKDQGVGVIVAEFLQQGPAKSALARTDLACDLHKPLPLPNAVKHVVQRLAMFRAEIKESRVRRDAERRLV